ncbi:hypothetical protein ACFVYC_01900 [Pseudarthrobacter sp. NPDC058329]|uniref:hypothetical protein n=1 Tax=Pseudarthrobacter sp. NPDC058329 TaxID=3346448 RepID=UPI0036D80151
MASTITSEVPQLEPEGERPGWLRETAYASVTVIVTIVAALIPLFTNPRFYFYDDTQSGAFGIWFEIGEKLRSGEWPLFSDMGWGAGNYTAEGQWGLWNPIIMLTGLGASATNSPVMFATILKISFLCLLSVGTFLLSREYGANRTWALIAGVAVPLTGFTVYMDAASWVTGLMVFALIPLSWYGLKRIIDGRNPLTGLVSGYLLITIGYVHGTIMLVLVILGLLLEVWHRRSLAGLIRLLAAGVILGLAAIAVYLPGVLTAPVTARETEISNTGFLTPDLTGFASSWIGSGLPQVSGWWGSYSPVPLLYIAWFLPLVVLLDFGRARRSLGNLRGILFFGIVSLALVLAPSDLGPLRFPVRLTPYVSLALLILLSVLLTRCRVPFLTRARVVTLACLLVAGTYIAWAQIPNPNVHLKFAALSAVGLGLLVFLLYGRTKFGWLKWRQLPVALMVGVTLATAIGQHHYFKATPLPDFGLPDDVRAFDLPLQKAEGVTFISGNPAGLGPDVWDETLLANSWYLNEHPVQNLYTPIMFKTYAEDLCLDPHGWTCPFAGAKLFTKDEVTGKLLVDLLSIDSVQLIRDRADEGTSKIGAVAVPDGWHVAETTDNTVLWVRDNPQLDTGNVVWQSSGVELTTVSLDSGKAVFRVDALPASGGKAVLSRLDWPGYTAKGATADDPLRGYLVQLDLNKSLIGTEITVEFQPPGWPIVVSSMIAALTLMVAWLLFDVWRRLRSRRVYDRKGLATEPGR